MKETTMPGTQPQTAEVIPPAIARVVGDLGKNWGWILGLGVLFVVLGVVALGMPVAMTLTTVVLFGVLLLAGGVLQIVDAFKCQGWSARFWHVLIGLLYIAAGVITFRNPALSSVTLTAVLGGVIIAVGVLRIIMGFQMKGALDGWPWLVVAGVVSLVLGGMILARWPESSAVVIGVLVAVELIMHGWSYIFLGLTARKLRQSVGASAA